MNNKKFLPGQFLETRLLFWPNVTILQGGIQANMDAGIYNGFWNVGFRKEKKMIEGQITVKNLALCFFSTQIHSINLP